MTGERMNKIYLAVCLKSAIELNTEEERDFYEKLVKEIKSEEDKVDGKAIEWVIP